MNKIDGGIGTIRVAENVFPESMNLSDWHKVLLLPENFHVIEARSSDYGQYINVFVKSYEIPKNELPNTIIVNPCYSVQFDEYGEKVGSRLTRIEISKFDRGSCEKLREISYDGGPNATS